MSKWFNPYRIIGMAVMSLNVIGQTRAKIDKIDPLVHLTIGASIGTSLGYYVHPAVPIAMEAANYAEPVAQMIEQQTNQYWLESACQVNQERKSVIEHEIDNDTVELEIVKPVKFSTADLNLVD